MTKPLGILEFGYIRPPDLHAYQVINSLFEEVSFYEELGYKRLWLSEHYSPEFAWFNPSMLLPLLAGYSEKIRIGIAGILLSYHSSLLVAQNFKLLSAVYPDRIDLGIAKARIPPNTNKFLISPEENERIPVEWERKINELLFFIRNDEPENEVLEKMVVPPHGTSLPEPWMLGASPFSMDLAIKERCNFCISFMHPGSGFRANREVCRQFREKYFKAHGALPIASALVPVALIEDGERKTQFEVMYGNSPETNIFGSREFVQDKVAELQQQLDCDELVLFTPFWERERRMETYACAIGK